MVDMGVRVAGQPMPPMRQFMVKTWMRRMEDAFVEDGVAEWLP